MPQSPAAADPQQPEQPADPAGLAEERDAYAAEAQALRRQLADANAREIFLNATIADLRATLANAARPNQPLALAA